MWATGARDAWGAGASGCAKNKSPPVGGLVGTSRHGGGCMGLMGACGG